MNDFLISKTKKFQFCHIFFLLCIKIILIFRHFTLFRQKILLKAFYYKKPNTMATAKLRAEIIKAGNVGVVTVNSTGGKIFLNAKKSLL